MNDALHSRLAGLVTENHVVLFMKGDRVNPQCGFSAQVVRILDELLDEYMTVDVLRSPELRDGIKAFSQWPTIPQLYIAGQFVGGCDLVRDMHATGHLQPLIGTVASSHNVPEIHLTESAVRELNLALGDGGSDSLRLDIDPQFNNDLSVGPRESGDLEVVTAGVTLLVSGRSGKRAHGLRIDFIDGQSGGFKLTNPNEPARVKALSPVELKAMLDVGSPLHVFDVRTTGERALAKVLAARHLDDAGTEFLLSLDRDTPVAFLCHHGMRSRSAAERALTEGFKHVYNIEGGIDAWSLTVDPTIQRY